jgi:hypothetical protein
VKTTAARSLGPSPVDHRTRNLSRGFRHAVIGRCRAVVHDDDDEAPHVELIRGNVRSDFMRPSGRRRGDVGYLDSGERGDRLRLAVFEDREVLGRQPTDWPPIPVEHGDIQPHELDAGPKCFLDCGRLRRLGLVRGARGDDQQGPQDPSHDTLADHLTLRDERGVDGDTEAWAARNLEHAVDAVER